MFIDVSIELAFLDNSYLCVLYNPPIKHIATETELSPQTKGTVLRLSVDMCLGAIKRMDARIPVFDIISYIGG